MPRVPNFRVNDKIYFLTFPNCCISKEDALDQLKQLQYPTALKFARVCKEPHQNGEPHLHVLLQFEGRFQCMNSRFFDLVAPTRSAHFHPNIQGAKSSSEIKSFIEKVGDFIDWGEFQVDARSARGGQHTIKESYARALNSGSKQSALQVMREEQPYHFILQYRKLNSILDRTFCPEETIFISKWNPTSFRIPDDLEQWFRETFVVSDAPAGPDINTSIDSGVIGPSGSLILNPQLDRPLSIVVEGPSRTGKTEWARSLGRHNYISGYLDFSPDTFKNDVVYNVIDNVPPQDLKKKHWKELIGAKRDWQSKYKYGRKPNQIKGGVPSIVLCNPGEGYSYETFLNKKQNAVLKEWTLHNAIFTRIFQPLYSDQGPPQHCEGNENTAQGSPS